jgi:cell wall-associated NlpC family hydrolase
VRLWVAWVLVCAAGCTPITARQARVWEAGGAVQAGEPDAAVPELVNAARTLAEPERQVVEAALAAVETTEPGLDCSNFVVRIYAAAGVALPRTVREQLRVGEAVEPSDLRPGDLVFFAFARRPADHVGIYAGNGRVVHVSASAGRVQLADLAAPPFTTAWVASRRVVAARDPGA